MPARNVEMMDDVPERVLIGKYTGARLRRQLETQAALPPITAGLHADFSHALGDGYAVGESIGMSNQILNIAAHWAIAASVG